MARILLILCLVSGIFVCAGKFSSPPPAHLMLQSDDYLWKLFARCEIRTDQKLCTRISYLPEVKALKGKRVVISGFMVPLETKEKSGHFLLSRRAPSRAFCPPAGPNEMMEILVSKPLRWEENLVTVSGTLELPSDEGKGIYFRMKDALGGRP